MKKKMLALVAVFATLFAGTLRAQPAEGDAAERPALAVLPLQDETGALGYWWHGGGEAAMRDLFVTEMSGIGGVHVLDRERLDALMRENGVPLTRAFDLGPDDLALGRTGRRLGVDYFLVGAVTEYGATEGSVTATVRAGIFDVSTGEIVWADEATAEVPDDGGRSGFDRVMKPIVRELARKARSSGFMLGQALRARRSDEGDGEERAGRFRATIEVTGRLATGDRERGSAEVEFEGTTRRGDLVRGRGTLRFEARPTEGGLVLDRGDLRFEGLLGEGGEARRIRGTAELRFGGEKLELDGGGRFAAEAEARVQYTYGTAARVRDRRALPREGVF